MVVVSMPNFDYLRSDFCRELSNLRFGNRLRLMFGLPLLLRDSEMVTSASPEACNGLKKVTDEDFER